VQTANVGGALGTGRARLRRWGRDADGPTTGYYQRKVPMPFDTLEVSLTVMDRIAEVEPKIRAKRKTLADEIGRAAESIALNVSEARLRAGLDKPDMMRRAAGSASELTTALRICRSRRYISDGEYAYIDEALDRVRAMLWRQTH